MQTSQKFTKNISTDINDKIEIKIDNISSTSPIKPGKDISVDEEINLD